MYFILLFVYNVINTLTKIMNTVEKPKYKSKVLNIDYELYRRIQKQKGANDSDRIRRLINIALEVLEDDQK